MSGLTSSKELRSTCLSPGWRRAPGAAAGAALFLATLVPSLAVPPPNDLCSGAESVPSAGPFPWYSSITPDISDATDVGDPGTPSCVLGGVSHSVWYRFTPALSGVYTLSVSEDTATTVPDTVMGIYSGPGCGGPFQRVACNDDSGSLGSALSTTLSATSNYFIVVWVSSASAPLGNGHAAVQLKVSRPEVPSNDTCAGAEPIPGNGPFPYLTAVSDITLAGNAGDPPSPTCQPAVSRSVWYRFTPTATATYTLSTCADTATTVYDTVMALYTSANDCLAPLTLVACNDDGCDKRAMITRQLDTDVPYYIVVWDADTGPFTPGETSVQLRVAGLFAPSALTMPATSITSTGAVLNAVVNPNGVVTTAWFEWGPATNFAKSTPAQALGSSSAPLNVSALLGGLTATATNFFRIKATNLLGANTGANLSFAWSSARPSLSAPVHVGTELNLFFTGVTHQAYFTLSSTNLKTWLPAGTGVEISNGVFQSSVPYAPGQPASFFRLYAP